MKTRYASLADVRAAIPKRRPESHKGEHGRLLIIGGGSRFVGAPALAGLAALRSSVDLAIIAAPEQVAWIINSFSPDLITLKLPCRDLEPAVLPALWEELKSSDAVIIGPGLGRLGSTREAVIELARYLRKEYPELPTIFDADGLKALAGKHELSREMPWILTPHAGEFRILTGTDLPADLRGRVKKVKAAAKEFGCVFLLKAHVDVIASPKGEVKINRIGNPGMTVGGTGDVLVGIIGTFLAQKAQPFKAAVAGAWANGRAGDICYKEKGYEFIASDLVEKLPEVFKGARRKGGTRGKVRGS